MANKARKIMALVLALVLAVSLMSIAAAADDGDSSFTQGINVTDKEVLPDEANFDNTNPNPYNMTAGTNTFMIKQGPAAIIWVDSTVRSNYTDDQIISFWKGAGAGFNGCKDGIFVTTNQNFKFSDAVFGLTGNNYKNTSVEIKDNN